MLLKKPSMSSLLFLFLPPYFSDSFKNRVMNFLLQWPAVSAWDCLKRTTYGSFQRLVELCISICYYFQLEKNCRYCIYYYTGLEFPTDFAIRNKNTVIMHVCFKNKAIHYSPPANQELQSHAIREENTLLERFLSIRESLLNKWVKNPRTIWIGRDFGDHPVPMPHP